MKLTFEINTPTRNIDDEIADDITGTFYKIVREIAFAQNLGVINISRNEVGLVNENDTIVGTLLVTKEI